MNEGLGAFYWYAWDDAAMGLAENKGRQPKAAAMAYQRAVEWFVDSRPQGCNLKAGVTECIFTRNGDNLRLVWSDERDRFYHILAGSKSVNISDFRGNVWMPKSGNIDIPLGPVPQLVRIMGG